MPCTVYENRKPLIMERSKIIFYFQFMDSIAWIQYNDYEKLVVSWLSLVQRFAMYMTTYMPLE